MPTFLFSKNISVTNAVKLAKHHGFTLVFDKFLMLVQGDYKLKVVFDK